MTRNVFDSGMLPGHRPFSLTLAGALIGVLTVLSLTGCPAAKLYKEGEGFEEAGKEYLAAQHYLKALGQNENHKKAREALVAVAEEAYSEKLGLATVAERNENYPKALEEFRAIDTLLGKLEDYDAVSFTVVNVRQKIEEMANASAEQQYKVGEASLAERAWESAIGAYKSAQGFKSGYKDTKEKVASAFYSWGEDEIAGSQYRDAAVHFVAATGSAGIGYKDAAVRAGSVYAALGKHFLGADRCRQSVKDLRAAQKLLGGGKIEGELAQAEECAVTPVAILPFENPTGTNLAGMALGDTIADTVGSKVRSGASEFVKLLERSALDAILTEQGLSASGVASGGTSKIRGVRYLVMGKLTQVKMENPGLTSSAKQVSALEPYDCEKSDGKGGVTKTTCERTVTLKYTERSGRISVRVAGTAKIVDVRTGEQLVALPLEAAFEDKVHFADSFTVNGNSVTPVRRGHRGDVRVEDDLLDLAKAKRALKDEDALAGMVVEKLSSDSSKAVLATIDIEKPATDPSSLALAPL